MHMPCIICKQERHPFENVSQLLRWIIVSLTLVTVLLLMRSSISGNFVDARTTTANVQLKKKLAVSLKGHVTKTN
jgi:hypothetical protein